MVQFSGFVTILFSSSPVQVYEWSFSFQVLFSNDVFRFLSCSAGVMIMLKFYLQVLYV
jgi:hypothetical protein